MMDILQILLALLMIGIAYQIIGLIFGVINFIISLLLVPCMLLGEAIVKKFGGSND